MSDWKKPLVIGFAGAIGAMLLVGMAVVAFLVLCFAIGDDPTPAEIRQREHHAALRQAYDDVGAPDSVRNYPPLSYYEKILSEPNELLDDPGNR